MQSLDGHPFGIGGLWENWKDPASGEWIRTLRGDHHGCQLRWLPKSTIACR